MDSDSTDDGAKSVKPVAFQGTPDPALVGKWVSTGGDSVFELGKDGNLKMTSIVHAPGASKPQERQRTGFWGVSDKTLYTKTTDTSGETVAKYSFEEKGNSLTVYISGIKMKTIFHRG